MPKNQFQRPLTINHTHKVPRHGKPQPAVAKPGAKPLARTPAGNLPPLAVLPAQNPNK